MSSRPARLHPPVSILPAPASPVLPQRSLRLGARPIRPVLRRCPVGADLGQTLAANWSRLCMAVFRSEAACAAFFGVTQQCAVNWFSGEVCRPAGQHVARMALAYPAEFAAIVGGQE